MKRASHSLLFLALFLLSPAAQATSYAAPERQVVASPKGAFVLDVQPEQERATLYAVQDRKTPLWSFSRSFWQERFFVADDGKTVAVLAWKHVRVFNLEDEALQFYSARGKLRAYRYSDLVAHPAAQRGIGPIGPFWREWFDEVESDGKTLHLRTSGPSTYTFAMGTGDIVEEGFSPLGGALWVLGVILLHLGILLIFRWRRAVKNKKPEARRLGWTSLGPVLGFIHLWLFLSGAPGVPAEWVFYVQLVLWPAALITGILSLVFSLRKPPRPGRAVLAGGVLLLVLALPWLLWLF